MKIYLDDIRNPKTSGWTIIRTASEAIKALQKYRDKITEISFDHDLGDDKDGTGYDVAKWIEGECFFGMKCPKWNVHSANPVGERNITKAMEAAKRYEKMNEEVYENL